MQVGKGRFDAYAIEQSTPETLHQKAFSLIDENNELRRQIADLQGALDTALEHLARLSKENPDG